MDIISHTVDESPKVPTKGTYLNELPSISTNDTLDINPDYQLYWESYERIVGKMSNEKPKIEEYSIKRDVVVSIC
jgi:hypothetical protein